MTCPELSQWTQAILHTQPFSEVLTQYPPRPLRPGPGLWRPVFWVLPPGWVPGGAWWASRKIHVLNHKPPTRVAAIFAFLTTLLMTLEQKALDDIFITLFFSSFPSIWNYLDGFPEHPARPLCVAEGEGTERPRRTLPLEEARNDFGDVSLIKRQTKPNRTIWGCTESLGRWKWFKINFNLEDKK